ncbi:MAG: four helix bundle protein [Candidatus Magasanikbacteria bacterium CG10_big_fil_rev_8_21_14_0_10_43_6]|uniref:Four helix bundle protein n=1 Tax=Candidatus Magasanikbacteria bacterium CG10_big_fil_rev_8_21_14_0_10_43_6 TaxID=1974650 RepID=A0A2M6W0D1_9BACT|nr:MAG: four helix bundle protein [Candidatus Magasanikbacteria bacterium CG10_big_fil_rev_8_21_14_0_10_43_6]
MSEIKGEKIYDLEQRTLEFAQHVRLFVRKLPRTIATLEDGKQLVRSSGSIGANYIEANENLSIKDFYYRVRICRKEAKETVYWLALLDSSDVTIEKERQTLQVLMQEATELQKIFGSIVSKNTS